MAQRRSTRLVLDLYRLENRIEAAAARSAQRRDLRLELLRVLNGAGRFSEIPEHVPNTAGLTERIYKQLTNHMASGLARALYESREYGVSLNSLLTKKQMHPSELRFVNRLASELKVSPHFGVEQIADAPAWMIDVDEAHQELRVWVREQALQDMIIASMEAFLVPAGSGRPSTEIYGIAFGSYREAEPSADRRRIATVDLNVERVCIQHRAKGYPSEVVADVRSEVTQLAMAQELFPFWHLVGDFHTHTYRNLDELNERHGWRYSAFDEKVNIEWCKKLRGMGHRPRVALIVALTRAGRQTGNHREHWRGMPNVVRTTVGKCHCFIAAYRIRPDGRYSTDALTLRCPQLGGQVSQN